MSERGNPFTAVRSEGGLLPPDLLARIAARDSSLPGLTPADYGLSGGERINEAAARAWARVSAYWSAYNAAKDDPRATASGLTELRRE